IPTSLPVAFVVDNVKAKSKVAWINMDVSQFNDGLGLFKVFYKKYQHIFCASKYAMKKFNEFFPEFTWKTSVFYSILDDKALAPMAEKDKGFTDQFDGIRILTIGRLSPEKGQDIIPEVLIKLKAAGYNARWYC